MQFPNSKRESILWQINIIEKTQTVTGDLVALFHHSTVFPLNVARSLSLTAKRDIENKTENDVNCFFVREEIVDSFVR